VRTPKRDGRVGKRGSGSEWRGIALNPMTRHARTAMMPLNRLAETEACLARTDSVWRSEMTRRFGPDGVLEFGYRAEGRGEDGTPIRRAFEARRQAVALWRHERRTGS
jgi:hypothetical protein